MCRGNPGVDSPETRTGPSTRPSPGVRVYSYVQVSAGEGLGWAQSHLGRPQCPSEIFDTPSQHKDLPRGRGRGWGRRCPKKLYFYFILLSLLRK